MSLPGRSGGGSEQGSGRTVRHHSSMQLRPLFPQNHVTYGTQHEHLATRTFKGDRTLFNRGGVEPVDLEAQPSH